MAGAGSGGENRIGLLGGTFDPPHNGHVTVAREALTQLALSRLLLVALLAIGAYLVRRAWVRNGRT